PASRDIEAELREAKAIRESVEYADFVESQRADYALPQDWRGANSSGHRVVKLTIDDEGDGQPSGHTSTDREEDQ
ncbi:hypothetical protein, partial [Trueperella sp.]|uniref:hypothetical protein n=1 Tax=Trueperella sp. TaxID=2699835 RepID=UPI003734D612